MIRYIFCFFITTSVYANTTINFEQFLENIRLKAIKEGVSKATLDKAFNGLTPNPKVITYDRAQAEFNQNFWRYINSRVSKYRIKNGIIQINKNKHILKKVYQKYGVSPYILVAFWGLESNYGNNTGNLNLIKSLATLSFDKRRSQFFTKELIALLKLIDKGKIPIDAKGSWAGAMGAVQFIPSNVAAYGVDANNNNKLELWNDTNDILASAANFLQQIGWRKHEPWGHEVILPKNLKPQLHNLLNTKKTITQWQTLGVTLAQNDKVVDSAITSLILPMGHNGPAFLIYHNFNIILKWNRSILYALSVGILADYLSGDKPLLAQKIIEKSLSRNNIIYIQTTLNTLGFDSGKPDGIAGPKTRAAVHLYQKTNNLTVDGYVGYQLFKSLKQL